MDKDTHLSHQNFRKFNASDINFECFMRKIRAQIIWKKLENPMFLYKKFELRRIEVFYQEGYIF